MKDYKYLSEYELDKLPKRLSNYKYNSIITRDPYFKDYSYIGKKYDIYYWFTMYLSLYINRNFDDFYSKIIEVCKEKRISRYKLEDVIDINLHRFSMSYYTYRFINEYIDENNIIRIKKKKVKFNKNTMSKSERSSYKHKRNKQIKLSRINTTEYSFNKLKINEKDSN